MNVEEDYNSDTDQSDEDFCPDDSDAGDYDVGSEEETSDHESEDSDHAKETMTKCKTKRNTKKSKSGVSKSKTKEISPEPDYRRNTRLLDATSSKNGRSSVVTEKDDLESDEDEKQRSDALWADFLGDVQSSKTKTIEKKPANEITNDPDSSSNAKIKKTPNTTKTPAKSNESLKLVTEVLDFAGEQVIVKKTVRADSIKENKQEASASHGLPASSTGGIKRSSTGTAGLGSILNQIGKKKKISVLDKSRLDWNGFKQDEGIEEQLATFNKGKNGYLERQDFLQRTDLRQFEIEKGMRESRRNN